jgi:hypothetical protein
MLSAVSSTVAWVGASSSICRSHDGKNVRDSTWVEANRNVCELVAAIMRTSSRPARSWRSVSSAMTRNRSPAGVSRTTWVPRSTSVVPTHFSSNRMRRLSVG